MKKGIVITLCIIFGGITMINIFTMICGPRHIGFIPLVANEHIDDIGVARGDLMILSKGSDVTMENGILVYRPDAEEKSSIIFKIRGAGKICIFLRSPFGIVFVLALIFLVMRRRKPVKI